MKNILFLFSDQHRASALGCSGDRVAFTPHLDQLASQGVRFDNAYSANPLCCPSRAALMTGRYSRNIGIYQNQDILEPGIPTFPRALSQAGYRTCVIGKTHFNGDQFHGFQERPYGDFYGQGHQPDPRRSSDLGEAGLGDMVGHHGLSGIPLSLTQTEICVAESSKWLQTHVARFSKQPFCLCVHFDKPHFPMKAPAHYLERYSGKTAAELLPEGYYDRAVPIVQKAIDVYGRAGHDEAGALASYYACIEWVDDAVGRILAVLEYLNLTSDTLVVYSSDHGELGGNHGAWNKSLFFEPSARVPLIMAGAGVNQYGVVSSIPVTLVDLCPTFCDFAGANIPEEVDGLSVLPLLDDIGQAWCRDAIYCETVFLDEPALAGCMIRTGPWKYALYLDGTEELYHLVDDPGEWRNLSASTQHAELIKKFQSRVRTFWEPERQMERLHSTPKVKRQKHNYPFSNQFLLDSGALVDARP